MSEHTLTALHMAYAALVGLPHGEYRDAHQTTMATVRDELARLAGQEPQDVQDQYEAAFGWKPQARVRFGSPEHLAAQREKNMMMSMMLKRLNGELDA